MTTRAYDLIIIGAGPVGENVADRAASGGLSVVIVEAELIGGECSYWACIPSKAILRPGAAIAAAKRVGGAAEAVTGSIDVAAVLKRRDYWVSDWDDSGQVEWLQGVGVDLVRGHGRITGPRAVSVTGPDGSITSLVAHHAVVVSTGSAALIPDVPGLAEIEPWTSREATGVQTVPKRLAILGGGVVAAEMATAYVSFGTEVTLIARSGLLGGLEPFAGEAVLAALREAGASVHLGRSIASASRTDAGEVEYTLDDGTALVADELLVATGRTPRTEDLGLETVGLKPGSWLDVDETLRVLTHGNPQLEGGWLYAVGDVNHRVLLTHQGKYQGRAAGDVIVARAQGLAQDGGTWGVHAATADHRAVPSVVFSDPEVASVGLTADAAEKAGLRVKVLDYDLGAVSGSGLHADGYTGQVRAIVDLDREVLVGMTLLGPDVAEMLHAATIAIVGEVPMARLWHAVPAFPTMSEVWLRLLEAYGRPEAED
ncbi:pyridine nucleotide-disulfide oxidoreductase [Leifsonia sp. Leaf325]|nr:NAD(P)/FAD-dependent oxidoreductase [Leifsonia sp. Leaf325]KQQ95751.1 pyridine nucleotide-disulfide oxidoreductase [Leifsonia sp. Leaf325]